MTSDNTKLSKYVKFVDDLWEDLTREERAGITSCEDLRERLWHFRADMTETIPSNGHAKPLNGYMPLN